MHIGSPKLEVRADGASFRVVSHVSRTRVWPPSTGSSWSRQIVAAEPLQPTYRRAGLPGDAAVLLVLDHRVGRGVRDLTIFIAMSNVDPGVSRRDLFLSRTEPEPSISWWRDRVGEEVKDRFRGRRDHPFDRGEVFLIPTSLVRHEPPGPRANTSSSRWRSVPFAMGPPPGCAGSAPPGGTPWPGPLIDVNPWPGSYLIRRRRVRV